MTINFKQKIIAIFFVFTLVIIVVTAVVHYSLLVKDIRELSQTQITSAFEMMFDGFGSQAKQTIPRIDRFIDESLVTSLHLLDSELGKYSQTVQKQLTGSWNDADPETWDYMKGYLLSAKKITDHIDQFVSELGILEYVVYDHERKVLAVARATEQKVLGMYLSRLNGGAFVPLLTAQDVEALTAWQGVRDISGTSLPGGIPAIYEGKIPTTTIVELSTKGTSVTLKFTTPVLKNNEFEGLCVIHIKIPESDPKRYSRFSQTKINIFAGTTLSIGMLPDYNTISFNDTTPFYHFALSNVQDVPHMEFTNITIGKQEYYQGRIGFKDEKAQLGVLTANFARKIEKEKATGLLSLITGITLILGLVTAAATYFLSSRITRPITKITRLMWQITEGDVTGVMNDRAYHEHKGRFGTLLKEKGHVSDEIESLSNSFYAMAGYLLEIAEAAENISLGEISQTITPRSTRDVLGNAFSQMLDYLHEMSTIAATIAKGDLTSNIMLRSELDAFGQTMQTMTTGIQSLIRQIRASAEQIATTGITIAAMTSQDMHLVQNVQESVADMVATMTEMQKSVEDVAQNMELLAAAVDETLTSVSDTTTSMSDIASNTRNLAQQTQEMITELDQTVEMLEGVREKTNMSSQLSQETIQDALEGQQAVEHVRESMDIIQHTNRDAEDTITIFAQRSREIDMILDVIYDVTEQSSLLALNASIIAAQAGSHGRGFSVIAEEMRNLANEVGASTKNIAAIVQTLQQDTNTVVQMIHDGTAKIEEGVSRTQQAQQRLEKIISSARRSSDVVSEIADALNVQMTTSHKVMKAMEHVHTMTTEITSSTNKQRITTMQIQDAVEHISELASHTYHDTKQQLDGVKLVLNAADTVKTLSEQNLGSSNDINHVTTTDLAEQAQILLLSVDRFRL